MILPWSFRTPATLMSLSQLTLTATLTTTASTFPQNTPARLERRETRQLGKHHKTNKTAPPGQLHIYIGFLSLFRWWKGSSFRSSSLSLMPPISMRWRADLVLVVWQGDETSGIFGWYGRANGLGVSIILSVLH